MHPDDDPAAMRGIPIFRPTMEEFRVGTELEVVCPFLLTFT
jgi:hypothetical protein